MVRAGRPLNVIGKAVESVARRCGYTIIENLCGHGVGGALHEEPEQIPGYFDPRDRRLITRGMVFAIEPFLSTGARWATDADDGYTLVAPGFMTAQYEHTVVATRTGAIVLTY